MNSSILLADLRMSAEQPLSLSFHDFEICMKEDQYRTSEILGFYLQDGQGKDDSCTKKHHKKALLKGHKAAVKAARIFNGLRHPFHNGHSLDTSPMTIKDTALVGGPPSEGHARVLEGVTSFQKTRFQFHQAPPQHLSRLSPSPSSSSNSSSSSSPSPGPRSFISSQYLHFSGEGPLTSDVMFNDTGDSMFDSISILSGMCLFSAHMLQNSLEGEANVDAEKLFYSHPTFYEAEYIARSCPVIADFAAMVVYSMQEAKEHNPYGRDISLNINLDVPNFHYYQSIDQKLQQGSCTFAEAARWMQAVQHRHGQISTVFQNYLHNQLRHRGVDPARCRIHISKSGNFVASFIKKSLENSTIPSLDHVLQSLCDEDAEWLAFYKMLPEKERPWDFRALGYLFYVFEVIRPALGRGALSSAAKSSASTVHSSSLPPSRPGRLLVSIDDGAERRIYSRSQKLLKKIRQNPDTLIPSALMEVYISRRVFINSNEEGSNLYLDDPTPNSPVMLPCKLLGVDRGDGCPAVLAMEFGPYDLIRSLYGMEAATTLKELFIDVGLL